MNRTRIARRAWAPALALFAAAAGPPAPGISTVSAVSPPIGQPARHPAETGMTLEAGSGRALSLSSPAATVFAADPKVVEVRPASPTNLFLFGVAPGRTTVAAMSAYSSTNDPMGQTR